jgi:exosome complex RNA-binding protein Rrp42 (RNase PH superfamily)
VQIGNVTVLAAIKVETMQPTDAAPDAGQVIRASLLP